MHILDQILEAHSDVKFLIVDGLNDAIIGVDSKAERIVYSFTKCIEVLMNDGLSREDAVEHFYHNIEGSYVGEQTPIFVMDDYE